MQLSPPDNSALVTERPNTMSAFFLALPRLTLPNRDRCILDVLRNRDTSMADHRPLTLRYFMAATGLSESQVSKGLTHISGLGMIRRVKVDAGWLVNIEYDPMQWSKDALRTFPAGKSDLPNGQVEPSPHLLVYRKRDLPKELPPLPPQRGAEEVEKERISSNPFRPISDSDRKTKLPDPVAMPDVPPPPPHGAPAPLPQSVVDAWASWKPGAFHQQIDNELRRLVADYGEASVLDALHEAALSTERIRSPFGFLRAVCQRRGALSLAITADAVGTQLTAASRPISTNRKTLAESDASPEVKNVLLALLDGFGLFTVAEPLPVALAMVDSLIREQAPALDPNGEDRTKTAALLVYALTHLPEKHYLRGKITKVAAFVRNISAITATLGAELRTRMHRVQYDTLAEDADQEALAFERYKRSIKRPANY